jgi:Protein of unknown function (DUF2924)
MHTIEVDFDVLKALMARRATEAVTNNDVLRDLLKLGAAPNRKEPDEAPQAPQSGDWVVKGVLFPAGTDFRARHNGQMHTARVEAGGLVLNGKRYSSPSHAASDGITGYSINGWRFWECRLPGQAGWSLMSALRKD